MDNRIAIIGIVVANAGSIPLMNAVLNSKSRYVLGHMTVPCREPGILWIQSVVLDAPQDVVSTLAGRIGELPGVSVRTVYAPFRAGGRS